MNPFYTCPCILPRLCRQRSPECLAWAWEQKEAKCHLAPWTVVGYMRDGFFSGVNAKLALTLEDSCLSQEPAASGVMVE